MTNLQKLSLVLIFSLFSVGTLAQDNEQLPPPPPPVHEKGDIKKMRKKMIERMKEKLDLSAEQAEQIKAIEDEYADERAALDAKIKAVHMEMKALRKAQKEEVDKVLTPEQKAKLEAMHEQRRERKGKRKEAFKKRRKGMRVSDK